VITSTSHCWCWCTGVVIEKRSTRHWRSHREGALGAGAPRSPDSYSKSCQNAPKDVTFTQIIQKFSGEEARSLSQTPSPWGDASPCPTPQVPPLQLDSGYAPGTGTSASPGAYPVTKNSAKMHQNTLFQQRNNRKNFSTPHPQVSLVVPTHIQILA